jgi:hypothetical protein
LRPQGDTCAAVGQLALIARFGSVADTGGELDGSAEEVVVLGDGLTGVQADAHAHLPAREVAPDLQQP